MDFSLPSKHNVVVIRNNISISHITSEKKPTFRNLWLQSLFHFLLFVFIIFFHVFQPLRCDASTKLLIPKKHLSGKRINLLISRTQVGAAESLAKWFKEETGATVRLIRSDYQDLLKLTLKDYYSNKPQLDVMLVWYVNLGRLATDGVIANLDEFYTKHKQTLQVDDYIPGIFDGYTLYNGNRWAIPFDGDCHILFYRKSIFAKHKLTPPSTWEEYTKIAKYITEKERPNGIYGTAIMAHPTPILIISSFMNRLAGFGGALIDDEKMEPRVNSTEAIKALEAMVEQSKYALPTPLETDFAVSRDAFLLGQVAMVEQWTDIGIMAEDNTQSFIKGDWGAVPMPKGIGPKARQSSSLNAGFILSISSKAPHPKVAEEFLLFSSRPDITLRLNLIPGGGGVDPTRKSVVTSDQFKRFTPVISEVESHILKGSVVVWPNHPDIPELLQVLSEALVAALENRLSPKVALDQCQEKWLSIMHLAQ